MFADVIFPVFTASYFVFFGIPWAVALALLVEFVIYRVMIKGPSNLAILVFTLAANFISWLLGVFITAFLPDKFGAPAIDAHEEPVYPSLAVLGAFGVAWALSILIDGTLWKGALYNHPELPVWKATAVANTASYVFLLVVLFVSNHFSLRLEM